MKDIFRARGSKLQAYGPEANYGVYIKGSKEEPISTCMYLYVGVRGS